MRKRGTGSDCIRPKFSVLNHAITDNYDARAKIGDGRTGGFVKLSSDDIAEIYRIAAKAEL